MKLGPMKEVPLVLKLVRGKGFSERPVLNKEFQRKWHLNSLVVKIAHGHYIHWVSRKWVGR